MEIIREKEGVLTQSLKTALKLKHELCTSSKLTGDGCKAKKYCLKNFFDHSTILPESTFYLYWRSKTFLVYT